MGLELTAEYRILTPLYLGGADQGPEMRAAALKGPLRFWYRAVDPGFKERAYEKAPTREQRLFGGTSEGAGQSPFLLRIQDQPTDNSWNWKANARPQRFTQGRGKESINGLVYLGFPFQMGDNPTRRAWAPGQSLTLRCIIPKLPAVEEERVRFRRALTAALWLLGHMGGAGSRSRRGFGALALTGWKVTGLGGAAVADDAWPELGQLSVLANQTDAKSWLAGFEAARERMGQWFGKFDAPDNEKRENPQPHLGPLFRRKLLAKSFGPEEWDAALADMGERLQRFRQRAEPDYGMVKEDMQRKGRLAATPPRASFGLPLTFRFSSVRGRPLNLVPHDERRHENLERHGSLLFLRPVLIGERLHPLFLRMDGAVPGESPPAAVRGATRALRPVSDNAMDRFFHQLGKGS